MTKNIYWITFCLFSTIGPLLISIWICIQHLKYGCFSGKHYNPYFNIDILLAIWEQCLCLNLLNTTLWWAHPWFNAWCRYKVNKKNPQWPYKSVKWSLITTSFYLICILTIICTLPCCTQLYWKSPRFIDFAQFALWPHRTKSYS